MQPGHQLSLLHQTARTLTTVPWVYHEICLTCHGPLIGKNACSAAVAAVLFSHCQMTVSDLPAAWELEVWLTCLTQNIEAGVWTAQGSTKFILSYDRKYERWYAWWVQNLLVATRVQLIRLRTDSCDDVGQWCHLPNLCFVLAYCFIIFKNCG